jgi:hypothetical protein
LLYELRIQYVSKINPPTHPAWRSGVSVGWY